MKKSEFHKEELSGENKIYRKESAKRESRTRPRWKATRVEF